MITCAAAGVYRRIRHFVQILTIADLFDGRRPHMPWLDPTVFRKAKREAAPDGQGRLDV